jgi:hypothetical protein
MIIIPISKDKDIIKYILSLYICYETYLDLKDEVENLYLNKKRVTESVTEIDLAKFIDNKIVEIYVDDSLYSLKIYNYYDGGKLIKEEKYDCNGEIHGTYYKKSTGVKLLKNIYSNTKIMYMVYNMAYVCNITKVEIYVLKQIINMENETENILDIIQMEILKKKCLTLMVNYMVNVGNGIITEN